MRKPQDVSCGFPFRPLRGGGISGRAKFAAIKKGG
jgi:hypothetical protein